jgi:hypothetical protein
VLARNPSGRLGRYCIRFSRVFTSAVSSLRLRFGQVGQGSLEVGPHQFTNLAAEKSHGPGRQPLVGMLWRIKTPAADEILLNGISDPDIALAAMSALRRRFGNAAARSHIAPLLQHADQRVHTAARQQLRRIDKQLASS